MPLYDSPRRPALAVALAVAAAAIAGAHLLAAQGTPRQQGGATRVTGAAVSATGERIVGAQVRVIGSANAAAITGDDGTFDLFVLNDTLPRLVLRRIGFRPETVLVQLPQPALPLLVIQMTRTAQLIRPVVVNASMSERNSPFAAVRERERTAGNGYFMFRDDFMKNNPTHFSDLLRRVPGVRMARTSRNFLEVRLRGARCAPLYWLDGQPLLGVPFDPEVLPPSTIEAIEVYLSAPTVPAQFRGPLGMEGCGAIVIWTRHGERPARPAKITADSIQRLLDAQRVFLASEVDQPARVVSIPEPEYPDSLRLAGVSGSTVIEFIVTAQGTLDKESVGIVSATHVRFGDAVRIAVLDATFLPAMKGGHAVAQVFQLPVTFTAPKP
jgi:TonB family protein